MNNEMDIDECGPYEWDNAIRALHGTALETGIEKAAMFENALVVCKELRMEGYIDPRFKTPFFEYWIDDKRYIERLKSDLLRIQFRNSYRTKTGWGIPVNIMYEALESLIGVTPTYKDRGQTDLAEDSFCEFIRDWWYRKGVESYQVEPAKLYQELLTYAYEIDRYSTFWFPAGANSLTKRLNEIRPLLLKDHIEAKSFKSGKRWWLFRQAR